MKILVIRHGESLADILNVHEGRADFELTDKGKSQAKMMSKYITQNFNISRIYSSTLKRAKQTAEILSKETQADIVFDESLMEFNNGKLAGVAYDVAEILYPRVSVRFDQAMYDMESMKEFHKRAKHTLSSIIGQTKTSETIVIVSHGGMIKQLYLNFLELNPEAPTRYPSGDTGIHLWTIKSGKRTIAFSNRLDHLECN